MDKTKVLQKLLDGTATKNEIKYLRQALASREISIGGNVADSNIVNGNENIAITNKEGTINIFVTPDKAALLRGLAQIDIQTFQPDNPLNQGMMHVLQAANPGINGLDWEEQLLKVMKKYRKNISRELEAAAVREDWSMGSFIKEEARFLPINASPYRPDALRGEPVNLIDQLRKNDMTIVLGEPGSGKSVALEMFAWVQANNKKLHIPFLFRLTELQGDSLLQLFQEELARNSLLSFASIEYSNPPLSDAQLYLLLDGLNEVQIENCRLLVKEIMEIKSRFRKVRIVVTSRIRDEGWRILQNTRHFESVIIQPIRLEDARIYLEKQLDKDNAKRLWESLDSNLKDIIRTPLILRLVKELAFRPEKNLKMPRNRGELYDEFIRTRFLTDGIDGQQARQILTDLEALAVVMQTQTVNNKLNIDEDRLFDVIKDDQRTKALRSGGFIIGEGRTIKFPHQTFQEFFVARAIRNRFMDFLRYSTGDEWKEWIEIFVFLSGLLDQPDKLIQAVYKKNVWLAWFCIEGNDVAEKTRNQVEARSIGLISSPFVEERRIAADVLSRMKLERCIPHLITLVKDEDREVSSLARAGLKDLSEAIASEIFNEFYKPDTSNYQRVQLGEALGVTRDIRPGVIVSGNNIPDLDWVEIPEGRMPSGANSQAIIPACKMSRYIVTNSQFEAFLNDKEGASLERWWTETGKKYRKLERLIPGQFVNSDFALPNHPAIYVSWFEASAFCAWLSYKLGYEVRLPTEGEWIRAAYVDLASEGSPTPYEINALHVGFGKSTPVGSFLNSASPFGVLDMMGNVFCWCQTKWRENILDPEDNDFKGVSPRVMRGGSFTHEISMNRFGDVPNARHYFVGFRVVCAGDGNG